MRVVFCATHGPQSGVLYRLFRTIRGATLPNPQLDDTDLAILRELAADSSVSNKSLAGRLGLAESTCAYRVRALREGGVIAGDNVRLDLAALGYPIQAVIKVRLGSHGAEHVNALYDDLV